MFGLLVGAGCGRGTRVKTIEIGDGSKVMDVPSHWCVETEEDGTVLAYIPDKDFANVRVSVVTIATEDQARREVLGLKIVREQAEEKGLTAKAVGDKCVFSYEEDSEEDGEALQAGRVPAREPHVKRRAVVAPNPRRGR